MIHCLVTDLVELQTNTSERAKIQNLKSKIDTFSWLGSDEMHLDVPSISLCGDVVIGCYGGRISAGANKNEDGALVWCAADDSWEFAVIIDAHYSVESAELLLEAVEGQFDGVAEALSQPVQRAFASLHGLILSMFTSPDFRARCSKVEGESSCLICARKDGFLWWLSIGDCVVYLLHPEFARLGQYALNQRSFHEWVGYRNTFDLDVPCYTSGVRQLGDGSNIVLMATDGLLECGRRPFEDPAQLYKAFSKSSNLAANVEAALKKVHQERGKDSATVITWSPFGNFEL